MKNEKVKGLPTSISETVRRLNPHLYGGQLLRPVESSEPKPIPSQVLARVPSHHKRRKRKERICITLVASRRREIDDDNNVASLKPLRDAIACNLSIDDGDERVRWEYGQLETKGTEGVIVKMEALCLG